MKDVDATKLTIEEKQHLVNKLTYMPCEGKGCHLWNYLQDMEMPITAELLFDVNDNRHTKELRCLGCLENIVENLEW